MAQLVARFHGMEEARGSNPLTSTSENGVNALVRAFTPFCFTLSNVVVPGRFWSFYSLPGKTSDKDI